MCTDSVIAHLKTGLRSPIRWWVVAETAQTRPWWRHWHRCRRLRRALRIIDNIAH